MSVKNFGASQKERLIPQFLKKQLKSKLLSLRISNIIGVNYYEADMYRRAFAKRNEDKIAEFVQRMGNHPKRQSAIDALQQLSGFGLCRAHAVNLGRLIWALAYQKAHNKEAFWQGCLNHAQGSYRRWVHKNEAKRVGIYPRTQSRSDLFDDPVYQYKKFQYIIY